MPSTLRFALIGLALVTSLAFGLIVINMSRSVPIQVVQNAPAPLMINQLVAKSPIPAGTLAKDEDFAVKSVASSDMATDALADTPENRTNLRGSLIRKYIPAGAPITMADVLAPHDRGFIANVLREGYLAVAVGVDQVTGVAGLIWPGDHVDVLLTQELEGAPVARKSLGETVLNDVRVIAIDQDMIQSAPANNAVAGKIVRTVTLEVDGVQAQKLVVAERMGKLSLAIRAAVDSSQVRPGAVFGSDVSPALIQPEQPVGRSIQVVNGKDQKEIKFK